MAEVGEVVEEFRRWDTAGSGVITRQGMRGLIAALAPGIGDEELDHLFEAAAADGLQLETLRYEDFLHWLSTGDAPPAQTEQQSGDGLLWKSELGTASSRASASFPPEKVRCYFGQVSDRLQSDEYTEHIQGSVFLGLDTDGDGLVSFVGAAPFILKCLACAADLSGAGAPSAADARAEFDAHDGGRGALDADGFLALMRRLQVRVAEAALPMSSAVREG